MAEDANRKGNRATERLVSLFEGLDWTLKGRTDVDAQPDDEDDRSQGYGIDSYFAYDDPHSPHVQGVILESKARAWSGITPQKVEDFFKQILTTVENAPDTKKFGKTHNFSEEADVTNTGILAIWCSDEDEYDHTKFREYVRSLDVPNKWDLANIWVIGNREIRRISRLEKQYHRLKQQHGEDLKIFYPDFSEQDGGRSDIISFDYLLSRYVYATVENENKAYVFYFDDMDIKSLDFMYMSLRKYQIVSNNDEIEVYVPDRGYETEPVEQEFKTKLEESGSDTEILFRSLDTASNLSHLDNR